MRSCRNISRNWDVSVAKVRVPGNPSRIDAKRGDHFLQADFTGLIPPSKPDSFRLADFSGLMPPRKLDSFRFADRE